jgi:hypothetical protein
MVLAGVVTANAAGAWAKASRRSGSAHADPSIISVLSVGERPLQVGDLARQLRDQLPQVGLRLDGLPHGGVGGDLGYRLGVGLVLRDRCLHLDELGPVAVEEASKLGFGRAVGWLRGDERRRVPQAGDRLVEPGAQLVAGTDEEQRVALRGVVLVGGSITDPADVVEPAVHSGGDEALITEELEALELLVRHSRDAELDEGTSGQRLPELPALDHRRVGVGVDRRLRRGAVADQQRLVREQVAEVGCGRGERTQPRVDAHSSSPRDQSSVRDAVSCGVSATLPREARTARDEVQRELAHGDFSHHLRRLGGTDRRDLATRSGTRCIMAT